MKIEVLDAAGKLMGTVPSTKRRGLSRVRWSMRLKPPKVPPAASAAFGAAYGPRVLPGTYTVKMTKDEKVYTLPLQLVPDSRTKHTLADRQAQFALATSPMATWIEQRTGGFPTSGLGGQFGVGLLLGILWSPCVGPTLGAASLLAAHGRDLGSVALTMLAFGIGTALPLLLLGILSRDALSRWRNRMLSAGKGGKIGVVRRQRAAYRAHPG